MAEASRVEGSPRLANVSAALLLESDSERVAPDRRDLMAEQRLEELALFFEDIIVVGAPEEIASLSRSEHSVEAPHGKSLAGIAAALEAAREDRVLLLAGDESRVSVELLLALTAWPEHDIVAPRTEGEVWPYCAVYRKQAVLLKAVELLEAGNTSVEVLFASLDCGFIEGDDLSALRPAGS